MSVKVGIVGAAGYAGAELIRLVLGHPEFELVAITSTPMPASRCPRCIRALPA